MTIYDRDYHRGSQISEATVSSFASRVYGWMTLGLLLTAAIALGMYQTGLFVTLMPFWWVAALGTFAIGMAMNFLVQRLSFPGLAMLFLTYSALQGVFFGLVLPLYAAAVGGQVIWMAFSTAALVFGVAAFYGIFTKSDLTKISRILQLALVALIVVTFLFMIMSFFMDVTWMHLIICYLGLGVFVGLTVVDANKIRTMSQQIGQDTSGVLANKMSLVMALKMYLNVIMIFWYILQIFSSNRR